MPTTLHLWDIDQGREVCQWPYEGELSAWVVHPSVPLVIAGDRSGAIHLLQIASAPFGLPR